MYRDWSRIIITPLKQTTETGNIMATLNFRHSLKTMNWALIGHNEKITHYMEGGRNVYHIWGEDLDGRWVTCGYFYSASDVAEYINKRNA